MRFKAAATMFAAVAAAVLLAMPAGAAPQKKRVVTGNGHTVFVSRDEDGRTRTRIIIQKRSYLDPGTETFVGENTGYNIQTPTHHASDVLDNTTFGSNQLPLPGPFTLPSKNNPWLQP